MADTASEADDAVCVLADDDADALLRTVTSALAVGPVQVGAPAPLTGTLQPHLDAAFGPGTVAVTPIALSSSVGDAWNLLLRNASADTCLLLHAGEELLAGRPGPATAFAPATVVSPPAPLASPDRLGPVRVVDRRHGRFTGVLRPSLDTEHRPSRPTTQQDQVVLAGERTGGPVFSAWLHFAARHLDLSEDPQDLVDLAVLLAATGEPDAAIVRLANLLGAFGDARGRRVARAMAHTALRRTRLSQVLLATAEWERISVAAGPAKAVRGLALAMHRRPGPAIRELRSALAEGLTDEDGVALDRTVVTTMLNEAKFWQCRVEYDLGQVLGSLDHSDPEIILPTLANRWCESGRNLQTLLDPLSRTVRAKGIKILTLMAGELGAQNCLDLAEFLWRTDRDDAVAFVRCAALSGELDPAELVAWGHRFRRAGLRRQCPVTAVATAAAAPPIGRLTAAAMLIEHFNDPDGPTALHEAALDVHPAVLEPAMARIFEQAPTVGRLLAG